MVSQGQVRVGQPVHMIAQQPSHERLRSGFWDGLAGHRAADAIERTLKRGAGYAADLDAQRSLAVGRQQPVAG